MASSSDSRKVREWRRRMTRFEEAQQSVAEFCRREGVSAPSFYQWRKRLAQRARLAEEAAGFRPVRLVIKMLARADAPRAGGGPC